MAGGTRHYMLGRGLVGRGYDVTIFASSFAHLPCTGTKLAGKDEWRIEEVDGIKFVWLKTTPYRFSNWRRIVSWCSYMLAVLRMAPKLVRRNQVEVPDVILGSSVHMLAVYAAYRLSRKFGCPFVAEIRDLWPQTLVDMGKLSQHHPLTLALRQLERFLYLRADKIIMLMPLGHVYAHSIGIPTEKIVWIPNGVDLSLYSGGEASEKTGCENTFTLTYAGGHGHANALEVLLAAAKIAQDSGRKDIRFVLVGDGPEKANLVAMKEQWELSNVEFRDPVPQRLIPEVFREADALVVVLRDLPLYEYGISLNKLHEYFAAMRPVLLAGNPGNNIVQEAECGITVPAGNPQALAEAVIHLADLPQEMRCAMARRGRTYVEQHHDFEVLAERLQEVMEGLGG